MPLRMRIHEREPIGLALRRFKKLLERSGIQKELRKRKYYEKPCEARRRDQLRKLSTIRKGRVVVRKP
jgi:small subunit ribosomal protein S21